MALERSGLEPGTNQARENHGENPFPCLAMCCMCYCRFCFIPRPSISDNVRCVTLVGWVLWVRGDEMNSKMRHWVTFQVLVCLSGPVWSFAFGDFEPCPSSIKFGESAHFHSFVCGYVNALFGWCLNKYLNKCGHVSSNSPACTDVCYITQD